MICIITLVNDASFYDKLDNALKETRTTARLRKTYTECVMWIECDEEERYAKLGVRNFVKIFPSPDITYSLVDNDEFISQVELLIELDVLRHE